MIKNLSIVVPTHRKSPTLRFCLEAIAQQAQLEAVLCEVAVVDNSQEALPPLDLKSLGNTHCEFTVLQTQLGVNAARNAGLQAAQNEAVLFVDDDCLMSRGASFLAEHLRAHQSHPNVFAVGGRYLQAERANRVESYYVKSQAEWLQRGRFSSSERAMFLFGGNMSLKKNLALEKNLFFDEKITYGGSETELFVHALSLNLECLYIDAGLIHSCKMGLRDLAIKSYRQGRGKKYREEKWGRVLCDQLYVNRVQSSPEGSISTRFFKRLQNYFFMRGFRAP